MESGVWVNHTRMNHRGWDSTARMKMHPRASLTPIHTYSHTHLGPERSPQGAHAQAGVVHVHLHLPAQRPQHARRQLCVLCLCTRKGSGRAFVPSTGWGRISHPPTWSSGSWYTPTICGHRTAASNPSAFIPNAFPSARALSRLLSGEGASATAAAAAGAGGGGGCSPWWW
jgi:hypothetical protein